MTKILVVDDNREGAESLSDILDFEGYKVKTAFDGQEALDLAESFGPDIILLDIGLPHVDGFDVCSRLRAMDAFKKTCIVAISGYSTEQDKLKSAKVGMTDHLVKPVLWPVLEALLQKYENPVPSQNRM